MKPPWLNNRLLGFAIEIGCLTHLALLTTFGLIVILPMIPELGPKYAVAVSANWRAVFLVLICLFVTFRGWLWRLGSPPKPFQEVGSVVTAAEVSTSDSWTSIARTPASADHRCQPLVIRRFVLRDDIVTVCPDEASWDQWMATAPRELAVDELADVIVETVFRGFDCSPDSEAPRVWETRVRSPRGRDVYACYTSELEAKRGHAAALRAAYRTLTRRHLLTDAGCACVGMYLSATVPSLLPHTLEVWPPSLFANLAAPAVFFMLFMLLWCVLMNFGRGMMSVATASRALRAAHARMAVASTSPPSAGPYRRVSKPDPAGPHTRTPLPWE